MRDGGVFDVGTADELREHPAAEVAGFLVFDFDDVGAEAGEKQSGERTLDFLRDLDDLQTFKRLSHDVDPQSLNVRSMSGHYHAGVGKFLKRARRGDAVRSGVLSDEPSRRSDRIFQ